MLINELCQVLEGELAHFLILELDTSDVGLVIVVLAEQLWVAEDLSELLRGLLDVGSELLQVVLDILNV